MVNLLNVLVFMWGTFWVLKAVSSILRGSQYSINFIMIIFYLFYFIPIGLDLVFGIPAYTYEKSFLLASHDEKVSLLYNLFIGMVPVIWRFTAIFWVEQEAIVSKKSSFTNGIYLLGLVSPVLFLLLAPSPDMYVQYGRAVQGFPSLDSEAFHAYINGVTYLSAISYFILLMGSRSSQTILVVMCGTPFLLASVWLNGKRAIIAFILMLIVYTLWKKRVLRPMKLLFVGIVCAVTMLLFSSLYQETFRYNMLQINDWEQVYHNMRVDLGRDDVTKMAIYAELYPDELEILDYRFQSFLFTVTMYVPREYWIDKPWPYAVYATSALMQIPTQYVGWSMTTGILDETIANVGWLGFLIGPVIISWIVRIGDRNQTTIIQLLTILVGSLMLVLQISAFTPIFLLWLILVGWQVFKKKMRRTYPKTTNQFIRKTVN